LTEIIVHRSVEDDAPVVVHQRCGCIHGKESAAEVGVDHLLEHGFVGRACRRPARNACVGEDDVQLAKVFGEFCEELLPVLRHCNVGAIAARFRSEFRHRFIQCLLVATRDGDFCAFRDEKPRRG
jgi:hypothetical protein